ncbi:oligosaccharide flippase family protein [Rhizobium sp. NFR03]|uniref:oligosaccharide flippase family protein n=1 Tax=Rhizobium sp. NFR03 TaxID=1566263 RepID=UPI0008B99A92|nr:oligosaccharide flippase family protein [Rhizobium sp. NFR03]SES42081.1 Membrane protein involved in the export of O-antigen and teichoic acid [Rhizobium sp. NFR03]
MTARRAFIMSSVEQYLAIVINVAVVATMARLLTTDGIGHMVTGIGIGAVALSIREFATPEFLIQKQTIDVKDIRTAFTLLAGITVFVTACVMAAAGWIARFYDFPELPFFLFLVLMSAFAEILSLPIIAIMRRDMAFGRLANIRTVSLVISAIVTMLLGYLDVGYMSYAWGMLAGAISLAMLAVVVSPYPLSTICRPSLASLDAAIAFGRYKGASQLIDRIYETVPQLLLGKIISMSSVGLYNRANTVCGIPDRIIMSAFYAMAFPALSASVREGRNIRQAYLQTLAYISCLYWPGVLLIAVTSEPIVNLVLGPQWHEAGHLVHILSLAAVFWFAVIVTNPLLLALGENRDAFLSSLFCRCIATILLCIASVYGVTAMALSQFVSLPIQMIISLAFAKRHLGFTLSELWLAIMPSVVVTAFTMAGPLALLAFHGWDMDMGLITLGVTFLLALAGWLPGLVLAQHPFLDEVRFIALRLLGAMPWLRRHFPALGA